MEMRCQKCGSAVTADQAFCSKCGAVVGMSDAGQNQGDDWNLAATMVGKKLPPTPPSRPSPSAAAPQPARASAPAAQPAYTPAPDYELPPQPARGSNATLLAVIGFVVVLIIGGLLILLFYLNSQG
ncbi:MAG: hypothetical protein DMF66_04860 [Acidobacteria bacterium]|nr:MAG: hypothetical protein DMF66_04860 [Acidobacteriota bacterium]